MSDHQTMSLDEFGRNEAAIVADVCAILDGKPDVRKKLRLPRGDVYERDTGQRVAELLRTSSGPVVVHRAAAIEDNIYGRPDRLDIREFRREHAIAPLTGDPDQRFAIKGQSTLYVVTGQNFMSRSYPNNALVFE